MGAGCCDVKEPTEWAGKARLALWFALIVNFAMFVAEIAASFQSHSVSLRADAMDFLSDSASYVITLLVLTRSDRLKQGAANIKAAAMLGLGVWVLGTALYRLWSHELPEAQTMGIVGFLALVANLAVALVLYRFRSGDINMRSVWICSRNDAIGNIAVMAAALGVWGTATHWPDLIVAAIISGLNVWGAIQVFSHPKVNAKCADGA